MLRRRSRVLALAVLVIGGTLTLGTRAAQAETPMYRFYKATTGEHFYTATFTEGIDQAFKSEGIGFQFSPSGGTDLIAIYRCNSGGRHFISTDANCEGQATEGQYGYIYQTQMPGTVPLWRYGRYNIYAGLDRVYTTDSAEAASLVDRGYSSEGAIGYVTAYAVTTATGAACNGSTDDTYVLQTAIDNAAGGHVIIPVGSGPCMVRGLTIPSNTQVTVNATLKFLPNILLGPLVRKPNGTPVDGTRNILNVYGTFSNEGCTAAASNVVIDGTGVLDGNRSTQTDHGTFMAGIGSFCAQNVMIIRPVADNAFAAQGLTVKNTQNSPINIVWTTGAVIQDVTAFDSGQPGRICRWHEPLFR